MKCLMEELRNNFYVDGYFGKHPDDMVPQKITTEWFDTYDKAVDNLIKILKKKKIKKIELPYLPVPYVIDDRGENYKGVLTYLIWDIERRVKKYEI